MPKIVMAVVPGWAVGGATAYTLYVTLLLLPRSTGFSNKLTQMWKSFDSGYGSAYLARQVGQKRAREIFFSRTKL